MEDLLPCFPSTRYQGSKRKLLPFIYRVCEGYDFESVLDLYSGTASVSLLFRSMGKSVTANDYMQYNASTARLMLSADHSALCGIDIDCLVSDVFRDGNPAFNSVEIEFEGIYFTQEENRQIDRFCSNIVDYNGVEKDLLIYLMGQAMLMKRPYNLFHRANLHMRTKDVPRSFGNAKTWESSFEKHMISLFRKLIKFPFDGRPGKSVCINTQNLDQFDAEPDFLYLDPPYLNKKKVAVDYAGFYHFLDGLIDYDLFKKGNVKSPHKPIVNSTSRWKTREGGLEEIRDIIKRWPKAIVAISYRGDGEPSIEDLKQVLGGAGYLVENHQAMDYKYALSKSSNTTEDIIIGIPPR
ncbi:DNA adenine methylase [Parasphingorhabdus sp.]|uniref:DNA adenine methylase n=1 Tax=Parasphingorhabdus sp. TaxID=2709688 RepID=UPI0039E269AB